MDLVTVFYGSRGEAQVLEVFLAAHGFFTHLPDDMVKQVYPLITGFGMFDLAVQVPRDQAEDAMEVIREIRASRRPEVANDESRDELADLETYGRRLRWACVGLGHAVRIPFLGSVVVAIWFVFYVRYLAQAAGSQVRPRDYWLTVASLLLVVPYGAVAVLLPVITASYMLGGFV